ncbi:fumarylacetoacetate hydrolase family protein [Eleftheria terrae]|uniref:fumarylacetoacetate hydrolase family protein n=1 Tax=Eleftheria terrae TaxID=1597781 RepID=UPI00263AEBA7|nr:fumarylacetoacetate hydrolase family protein [Eleftheria terrae]WKB51460.1 fumarylacetoacetate hydrolase family protein [Eleftheria terrae]
MKLATYKDGSRDGQLVVVSRDLGMAHYASGIATRLQQVLDDWNFLLPQLQDLSTQLNQGRARHAFPFDPSLCMAPLPRAYQWISAEAYLQPLDDLRQAGAGELPPPGGGEPLLLQGASDDFLGPCDDIVVRSEEGGIDFGAGLAVVTGDIPMGVSPPAALDGVRLVLLVNDVGLRHLGQAELARDQAPVLGRPAAAFAPLAVTPDELGSAWQGGRVHLPVRVDWNGRKAGACDAGAGMHFHFGQLISHLCKTRRLRAGAIVGSGRVVDSDAKAGYCSIAVQRARERLAHGEARTGYLRFGDSVRIEVKGEDEVSVFGAIDQDVAGLG